MKLETNFLKKYTLGYDDSDLKHETCSLLLLFMRKIINYYSKKDIVKGSHPKK